MKQNIPNNEIQKIPIDKIKILNPRARGKKVFLEIVENTKRVGLKRPITVTRSYAPKSGLEYDLVCGQGRIEAYQACGETHIPSIVVDDSEETALLKGLVENLARRQHRPIEYFIGIKALQEKGYNAKTISAKTGMDEPYTKKILDLLERGEERLLAAVASGHLPISAAAQIALSPEDKQRALHEAYENGDLKGGKIEFVQRLLEKRNLYGKEISQVKYNPKRKGQRKELTGPDVMKIYQNEVNKKQSLTRKANQVNRELSFISEALRQLFADDRFVSLLKSEGFNTMPKYIAESMEEKYET